MQSNSLEYNNNRIQVRNRKSMLEIRIPIKKNGIALLMMLLATAAWTVGLYVLVRIELHLQYFWYKAGLILAIAAWFVLGMTVASFFIWLFFGRERILITNKYLITDKHLVLFYRRNIYDIAAIFNLRTDIEIYKANRGGTWIDESRTVIRFDTTDKLVTFARGITKQEAEFILLQLAKSTYLQKQQFAVEQHF